MLKKQKQKEQGVLDVQKNLKLKILRSSIH